MMVTTDPGLMKYLTSVLQQMSGGKVTHQASVCHSGCLWNYSFYSE